MGAKYPFWRDFSGCFIVSADDIRAIHAALADRFENVSVFAYCTDGTSIDSIESILAHENPSYRRISSITLRGRTGYEDECEVTIAEDEYCGKARFNIATADEMNGRALESYLVQRINELRASYSYGTGMWVWYCAALLALLFLFALGQLHQRNFISWQVTHVILISLGVPVIVTVFWGERIRKALLPPVVFTIGKQADSVHKMAPVRLAVVTSVFVAFLVGLAVNVITPLLINDAAPKQNDKASAGK